MKRTQILSYRAVPKVYGFLKVQMKEPRDEMLSARPNAENSQANKVSKRRIN